MNKNLTKMISCTISNRETKESIIRREFSPQEANLLLAAPAMYAALKAIVSDYENSAYDTCDFKLIRKAKEALAKGEVKQ